jgi:glycine/D-amino acid oxidase-like deaminating enzyme
VSVSYWMDNSSRETITKDIVIIGGGIAGLSAAYWLYKEDPSLDIALVEKYELGEGATGRNAGFITCGSVEHFNRLVEKHGAKEAAEIWKFSEENLRLLKEEIICEEGDDLLFSQKGSFSLASTENEFAELKSSSELMKNYSIDVEELDEKAIQARLCSLGFVGGIKYCDDASIHPLRLLRQIRKKLDGKVSFYENHEVYNIETKSGTKIVRSKKAVFEAPIVLMATNGYSSLLDPFFKDKIFPTRGQILATSPVPQFMEAPCYANFVLDYFRQLPTGEVIIGGFRQLQKDAEIGYSDQTTDIIQNALEDFLQKHIPKVRESKITHRWSGIMGFSIDGQPMVGALPTDSQLFFIGGFTAHGLGLAFHCGKILADSLFERVIPAFISARRLQ